MEKTWLHGGCFCGNIRYQYQSTETLQDLQLRGCGCTFCTKQGARYISSPMGILKATIQEREQVRKIQFGSQTASFYICAACGVMPFVTSTIANNLYAVLNANTLDGIDLSQYSFRFSDLDGETLEDRLARRSKVWIGQVSIEEANPNDTNSSPLSG